MFDSTGLNLTAAQNIVSALPVSSHFIVMTRAAGGRTYEGTISFNQNVIAIQRNSGLFDAPRSAQLQNGSTDFTTLGGSPGTEVSDVIRLVNAKTISFSMTVGANNTDAFRVLTAVPEPKSWAMLLTGFGLVGFAARRRRVAVAA